MKAIHDLMDQRFGRLLVLKRSGGNRNGPLWLCQCDCGTTQTITTGQLRSGKKLSCGCLLKSMQHGGSRSREYSAWSAAKDRCYNANMRAYRYYGGRGIVMCESWLNNFAAFRRDMGPCPEAHTLDRIDNGGPYSPDNCRWATWQVQYVNKRSTRWIDLNGERMTASAAAKRLGINGRTFLGRLRRGMSPEKAAHDQVIQPQSP